MRLSSRSFWAAQLAGWGGYGLVLWLSSLPLLGDASFRETLPHLLYKGTMAGTGVVVSLALAALYERLLPREPDVARLALVAAVASFALGVVQLAMVRVVMQPGAAFGRDFFKGSTSYGITLLAWSALYLTFSYRKKLEEESARALKADALASEARLQMLRYQVNPHFLFNALNSIRALVDEDPRRAREMVTELAEFFRYSLLHAKGGDAPLSEELDAVKSYLAIQKIRFEERLDVAFDVSPAAAATRLPGFLVHPFVENAVKYGMETSPMPLRLSIAAAREGRELRVEVANTGRWLAPERASSNGTGTGLSNVRARLEQLFPGRHRLDVAEDGGWVRARLTLALGESS